MTTFAPAKPRVCADADIPAKLNGYPVISHTIHATCVTVAVDRGDCIVVATWWPELGDSWMWGHYLHGLTGGQQQQEYLEIAARNARRT